MNFSFFVLKFRSVNNVVNFACGYVFYVLSRNLHRSSQSSVLCVITVHSFRFEFVPASVQLATLDRIFVVSSESISLGSTCKRQQAAKVLLTT